MLFKSEKQNFLWTDGLTNGHLRPGLLCWLRGDGLLWVDINILQRTGMTETASARHSNKITWKYHDDLSSDSSVVDLSTNTTEPQTDTSENITNHLRYNDITARVFIRTFHNMFFSGQQWFKMVEEIYWMRYLLFCDPLTSSRPRPRRLQKQKNNNKESTKAQLKIRLHCAFRMERREQQTIWSEQ